MYIFDLEGTLSDSRHRDHLVPDWDEFHKLFPEDGTNENICKLFRILAQSANCIILTGMMEKHRTMALAWLKEHRIPHNGLVMRPNDDLRTSPEYKLWNLNIMEHPERIKMIFDDRLDIITTLLDNNYPAIQVKYDH